MSAPAGNRRSPIRRTAAGALAGYRQHLDRSALAPSTRLAYGRHAARYLTWLAGQPHRQAALEVPDQRDWAVRDWRRSLIEDDRLAPATVNAALAGVDDLYRHLGIGPPRKVARQHLPPVAPRALTEVQLRRLLRAVEARCNPRDRAAIALMAFAGLRVSEVAAVRLDDIAVTARTGRVHVRAGKGDQPRDVPLPAEARSAVADWLAARPGVPPSSALFPGPDGRPVTVRCLHRAVTAAGNAADLTVSPHALRHTYVTRLVRQGADLPLVADLAGHRRLETTRRYSLPTDADRQAIVESLVVDY